LDRAEPGASTGANAYRLLHTRSMEEIDALVARAAHCDPTYAKVDLNCWWQVFLPTDGGGSGDTSNGKAPPSYCDPTEVDRLVAALHKQPEVDNAYAMRAGLPPSPPFDGSANTYLQPAPQGLDILHAWSVVGGDKRGTDAGKGVTLVDIEGGWDSVHEDLPTTVAHLGPSLPDDRRNVRWHGTNVLGVLFMQSNNPAVPATNVDGVGVAPAGQGYTMGHTFFGPADPSRPGPPNVAVALMETLLHPGYTPSQRQFLLEFGDVILLEEETGDDAPRPIETDAATFALIRIATALGIIVVEAAGNGRQPLDSVTDSAGKHLFNPDLPAEFRDSGAIMVGACDSERKVWKGAQYHEGSNTGRRVDVFATGVNVSTTGSGSDKNPPPAQPTDFRPNPSASSAFDKPAFGATSAAAAIIAGTIMVIQGIAQQQNNGLRFSPSQMRQLLKVNGTPSIDANLHDTTTDIGVMPDLQQVLSSITHQTDIYLHHTPNDTGDGMQTLDLNTCCTSPDILLNPGFNNEPTSPYRFAADNTIVINLFNRGTVVATSATATLYWVHTPDMSDPSKWTLIGTAAFPDVPPRAGTRDGSATSSVPWLAGQAAPTGDTSDLCLIAIATCPTDPGISVQDLITSMASAGTTPVPSGGSGAAAGDVKEALYLRLLQGNNNVAQVVFGVAGGVIT
jgi:serine protease